MVAVASVKGAANVCECGPFGSFCSLSEVLKTPPYECTQQPMGQQTPPEQLSKKAPLGRAENGLWASVGL